MSAMLVSGSRQLARNILTKFWFSSPFFSTFMGGMRSPSWKISEHDSETLPGTFPPTSM